MPDPVVVAGVLLVLAPLLGLMAVAYPPLIPVWTTTRERHITIVAVHRRAWRVLNAGFALATLGTAAGLVALAVALGSDRRWAAIVGAIATVYAMAGVPWLAVLGIRARTTPALADLGVVHAPPAPVEVLLEAATGGLFATFAIATGLTLAALGTVLAVGGIVAVPVALLAALIAAALTAIQVLTGDSIPAFLYLPSMLIGVALLAGWT
jgi:hypothetical protein